MKKCLILLAMLIVTLVLSKISDEKAVEKHENSMALNNTEVKYSVLKE